MSEEMIVRHCSPTLAGLKTGNLFSCSYNDKSEILGFLREWNTKLRSKGVRLIPLRLQENKALINVYRPSQLSRDLSESAVCELLSQRGYCTESCEKCVVELMKRIRQSDDFPHEIGLFLGYPCEDVRGFIENKAACAKCVGCLWSAETRTRRRSNSSASRNAKEFIKSNTRAADRCKIA